LGISFTQSVATIIPVEWKKFESIDYAFSFFYPPELVLREESESGRRRVIRLENVETGEGLQVYIQPYNELSIDKSQYSKDLAGAPVRDKEETVVADVSATAFRSEHPTLGETREVWFIRGGYLFQVTSPKPYEAQLSAILSTWR
jgi:hypothetical protein